MMIHAEESWKLEWKKSCLAERIQLDVCSMPQALGRHVGAVSAAFQATCLELAVVEAMIMNAWPPTSRDHCLVSPNLSRQTRQTDTASAASCSISALMSMTSRWPGMLALSLPGSTRSPTRSRRPRFRFVGAGP